MLRILTALIMLSCSFFTVAQSGTDSTAVMRASNHYIEGFYFGDTTKIYHSIDTAASKHGYYKTNTDTAYRKIPMSFAGMLRYSKNPQNRPSAANANIREVTIMDMHDKIAAVKVRVWWGVDYLLLAKLNGRWMVEKVLWQSL